MGGAFMALSKEKFHLRTEHSKLLGYWTVELGGLNQVTHLWEYDSYSHRAGVRAKLGGHQQWQEEYFQKILPWLQHQDNMALRSLAPPATLADPGEAWELWQLEVSGGGNWENQLVEVAEELEEEVEGVKLGGLFTSVFGPIQTGVVLWQHKLLDNAPKIASKSCSIRQRWCPPEEGDKEAEQDPGSYTFLPLAVRNPLRPDHLFKKGRISLDVTLS